ncbi:MAG: exodeoxyribonuclease VII large subunit, partial [Lachnospiraceae bacterium]|nr:exodeoxyribonuclease VII large subunit [Lachnospiraceae bacterium]
YPIAEIVLCPTTVQGEKAAAQLTKAVKSLSAVSDIDVIIIGRGGGSFEDLNCFNDENLVREIYKSEKPIISAVGHETDFTLCDFVSDVRAPTPSAAAELAVPNVVQVLGELRETYLYMQNIAESRFDTELADIERLRTGISVKKAMDSLESDKDSIESIFQRIKGQVSNYISMEKLFTDNLADKISNLSPINTLKRGYACVTKNGSSVNGVYDVACGDILNVHMSDGVIKCTVDEVKNG